MWPRAASWWYSYTLTCKTLAHYDVAKHFSIIIYKIAMHEHVECKTKMCCTLVNNINTYRNSLLEKWCILPNADRALLRYTSWIYRLGFRGHSTFSGQRSGLTYIFFSLSCIGFLSLFLARQVSFKKRQACDVCTYYNEGGNLPGNTTNTQSHCLNVTGLWTPFMSYEAAVRSHFILSLTGPCVTS